MQSGLLLLSRLCLLSGLGTLYDRGISNNFQICQKHNSWLESNKQRINPHKTFTQPQYPFLSDTQSISHHLSTFPSSYLDFPTLPSRTLLLGGFLLPASLLPFFPAGISKGESSSSPSAAVVSMAQFPSSSLRPSLTPFTGSSLSFLIRCLTAFVVTPNSAEISAYGMGIRCEVRKRTRMRKIWRSASLFQCILSWVASVSTSSLGT